MQSLTLFETDKVTFEDFKNQEDIIFWWATDIMKMLWYDNMKEFQKVLDKVTKVIISLGINHYENIIMSSQVLFWSKQTDFKLTRFACYLIAMNSDSEKPEVARCQLYFTEQTIKFEEFYKSSDDKFDGTDRIITRDEIKEWNKSLSATAKKAGVIDYWAFQNAWYLGMYNRKSGDLAKERWVSIDTMTDYMWRTELAANLFRITQTDERIKNKWITWQKNLEEAHFEVWQTVREMTKENTWRLPEHLKQEKKLSEVRKWLKIWHKDMNKKDKLKKR